MNLVDYILDIPDFPKPGVLFKDITPLLKEPAAFTYVIDRLAEHYQNGSIDAVVAIEARGFLVGAPLAYRLEKPLVPVRKKGKLPFDTRGVKYSLEYGSDIMEMHVDAVLPGNSVVIVDDVLASGGTMVAASKLVEESGGRVEGLALVIELVGLRGRELLQKHNVFSLLKC